MSRVSTDFRRNVRRQRKRVGELGQVEFRCVTEAADLPRALELFLEVEAASWKGASGTNSAILLHDKQIRFYRTLVDDFSKSRSCAINLVLLDDRCVAGQLALIVGDTLSLLKIAYRDEFKAMGAGNVLLDEVIRRACQSGRIAHISFITGAAWNDRWSPASADVYESYVYNSTATGIAAYALEKAKDHGRRFKHWALDLHGGPSAREGVAQAAPHGHGDADEARGR